MRLGAWFDLNMANTFCESSYKAVNISCEEEDGSNEGTFQDMHADTIDVLRS